MSKAGIKSSPEALAKASEVEGSGEMSNFFAEDLQAFTLRFQIRTADIVTVSHERAFSEKARHRSLLISAIHSKKCVPRYS